VCSCCGNPQALAYALDIRLNDSLTAIFDRSLCGAPEEPRDPTGHTTTVLDQRLDHRRLAEGGGFAQRQELPISHISGSFHRPETRVRLGGGSVELGALNGSSALIGEASEEL
jgi:hypothetical protein